MQQPRLALRLAGLQAHRHLRAGSPGKAFTPQPGIQVHRRLRASSPGKAFTPQPGERLRAFFQLRHHQLMASIKELQVGQIPGDNR
ncbi:hypothetical protein DN614_22570 [Klebsiella michiganensis]|nr:hypothetical protein [Klebsiella michiganensis]MBE0168311.1 hypothetical protein [Klebsiella michiganensis]MBE0193854.1 hypothetical protein [Klebsiella michiganensis]MBE0218669.1 hypothetical protein [Klebsiella michiganensis]MBE0244936.1 hypothetical protein [Klebsiella michiganensis]